MACASCNKCIGGPGFLPYCPQCLLPPIMRLRFCVYEGFALIECMCIQCKKAHDPCTFPHLTPENNCALTHSCLYNCTLNLHQFYENGEMQIATWMHECMHAHFSFSRFLVFEVYSMSTSESSMYMLTPSESSGTHVNMGMHAAHIQIHLPCLSDHVCSMASPL